MILIADCGSTKATWCLADRGRCIQTVCTGGINPYFQSEEEISEGISNELFPRLEADRQDIEAVYFYGAGCVYEKTEVVWHIIKRHTEAAVVEVHSDLLAAARGTCGESSGLVCVLGTGSNACFYDGQRIIQHVPSLGFILGDEGGGAVLGKLLVSDLLKDMMGGELKEKFLKQFNLTPAQIIDRVYRQPFPNRFLASLSPFLYQNLHEPAIRSLVLNSIKSFILRNLMKYDYRSYRANFVGSTAYYYKEILLEAAVETGIRIGTVCRSPMEGLLAYHGISG
ncbi:MAG: ATPase [Tannerellaceae bacterium]|nr:ATPase [Tannerellaceae bacterium]